jgi:NADH-quinone oxidoreductase subunit J
MVLFLFVVMLMGPQQVALSERLAGQRWLAIPLVVILLVGLLSVVATNDLTGQRGPIPMDQLGGSNPQLLGELLYTRYIFPFEVVSILLLVAMIGAVVLAKREAFVRRLPEKEMEGQTEPAVADTHERAKAA